MRRLLPSWQNSRKENFAKTPMVNIAAAQHFHKMPRKPYKKNRVTRPRKFIREWRDLFGWTQEQLSEHSGVDVPRISKLETGKRKYRQEHLEAIAQAFHCEPPDLLRPPSPATTKDPLDEFTAGLSDTKQRAFALKLLKAAIEQDETV